MLLTVDASIGNGPAMAPALAASAPAGDRILSSDHTILVQSPMLNVGSAVADLLFLLLLWLTLMVQYIQVIQPAMWSSDSARALCAKRLYASASHP